MDSRTLLTYAYEQVAATLRDALRGLDADRLAQRPGPDANPIGWLAWHLLRVQDDHVAEVAGTEQVWTAEGWADRFALPVDTAATGYGMSRDEVAAVRVPSVDLLLGYSGAVHAATGAFLRGLTEDDLDRVVDERWDPPVTLGVRLVSVLSDDLQHLGQIGYAHGLLGG
ncbi:DinB family protein [Geodermatophilus sp. SYSU D00758]